MLIILQNSQIILNDIQTTFRLAFLPSKPTCQSIYNYFRDILTFFTKDNQLFLDKYQGKLFHNFRRQDQLIGGPLNADLNHLPSDLSKLLRFPVNMQHI